MKDNLTKLCDKIENCNKCGCHNSEIVCVKYWVGVYINRDRNKFLRLKAEVNSHKNFIDDFVILTYLMTIASILITIFDTIFSIMFIINIIELWGKNKWVYRNKWIYYIEVVLEDMERNPAEYNISD